MWLKGGCNFTLDAHGSLASKVIGGCRRKFEKRVVDKGGVSVETFTIAVLFLFLFFFFFRRNFVGRHGRNKTGPPYAPPYLVFIPFHLLFSPSAKRPSRFDQPARLHFVTFSAFTIFQLVCISRFFHPLDAFSLLSLSTSWHFVWLNAVVA